jgi:ATP-dependent Clp protease ATP-binding subunit ClpA
LLAILKAPGPVVSVVLETAGLDYERGLAAVEGIPRDRSEPAVGMPFTPGAKKAMELALRYCIEMGSSHIGHEHLLLGIAREEDGLGARVLSDAGLDLESIRRKLALAPAPLSYELSVEMAPGFRVVELSGTAQEWEGQLNSLASRGYELVEIVSGKAVFRTLTPET